ncbi:hypothetical protein RRF57_010479 [Xylaria bambusicola]|uniref:Uncharacterized protein n=1 Tax=Xylaria bambusicola TaxID=326684 RepID=A0AAN7UY88_9PEZI
MPLMQKWSQGDLDKMSIAVLQKQNKKPTAKEIEYTALILQRILSTTEEHDASFRQGSSRRLIRLCNGMLHILDRCLDGLEGLDETLVRDTRSAVDRLRHKLDTQKQQSEHPLDQINQMPNESAISLLLLTYVEVHGSMKIGKRDRVEHELVRC